MRNFEELCRKIFNNAKNSKLPHELKSKNYPISHAKLSIPFANRGHTVGEKSFTHSIDEILLFLYLLVLHSAPLLEGKF